MSIHIFYIHTVCLDEDIDKCLCRSGCLKLFCSQCIEQQNLALSQVQKFMEQLEYAESLFPSSRAFAVQYPLFKSPEFTNRVKASIDYKHFLRGSHPKLLYT